MGNLSARLDGCNIFSKLDLQKGYYQVTVPEFVRMPFGLKNAGMTFQQLMDRIFFDLPFCFVYLDGLLVASCGVEEHSLHLRDALRRLQANGLVINREKCVFECSVEFLGHSVSAAGMSLLLDLVDAIRKFPWPVYEICRPFGDHSIFNTGLFLQPLFF
jgi:hypothetical protein